ncbi:MAG: hypothetical protein KF846_16790 [Cyclobacteriaceae bacterium]|nr:hypothetical protein [Cyclobacteriaceae bacterium]MBX2957825.1 hypothetical protein [Cyclobacteriaceae bacterium]
MWVALTIIGILFLLLLGFLITPIVLYIDTDEQRYEVRQLPAFKFFVDASTLKPQLKFLGFPVPITGWKKGKKVKSAVKKSAPDEKRNRGFRKSFAAWRFLVQRTIRSFTIKRCTLLVDTDDVTLNAKLTPVCMLASRGPFLVQTNFEGRVYFHLETFNRPGRLLWIFLQFLTKK